MKKIVTSLLVVFLVVTVHAQVQWGVRAGGNMSSVLDKEDGRYEKLKLHPGFHVGGTADIFLSDKFSLQPALLFTSKGFKVANKSSNSFDLPDNANAKLTPYYLELPVNLIFKPRAGNGNLLLGAGPYIAYGVGGRWKATFKSEEVISVKGKLKFVNDYKGSMDSSSVENRTIPYTKPFDFGANLLLGYEFANHFYLQLNGQLGLINVEPSYNGVSSGSSSVKNVQFGLSIGYKF
ncbi:MAG: porin family protein [Niabella sp.]